MATDRWVRDLDHSRPQSVVKCVVSSSDLPSMSQQKRKGLHPNNEDCTDSQRPRSAQGLNKNARTSTRPYGTPSGYQGDEDRGGSSSALTGHIQHQQQQDYLPMNMNHLRCPLCSLTLRNPTTLQCGHSICANHVTDPQADDLGPNDHLLILPQCPLNNCRPHQLSTLPRIPSTSRVRYRPAPTQPDNPSPPQPKTVKEPRLDVTLNKVLSLVSRTNISLQSHDEVSDSDSPSHSSAHHPNKRHRRHSTPDKDVQDDLLTHLRKQAVRERTLRYDEPILPSSYDAPKPQSKQSIFARFQKDLLAELSCEICFALFHQPITTPCQHTFCAKCLQRSLDHSSACPLCRQDLPAFTYFQDHPTNKTLLSIILDKFSMTYKEREEDLAAEERDARLDTPIFVCQLSFPGMPTLLHFFEPRYRLMLRRCLESPIPCFGMIMPPKPGAVSPQVDYGTMLEIRSVQMLPDGRSMVETWGTFRFRILERGTVDGYMVGRIERIDDYEEDLSASAFLFPSYPKNTSNPEPPEPSSSPSSQPLSRPPSPAPPLPIPIHPNSPTNQDLMETCRAFLDRLQRGSAPWVVQRLSSIYGTMPTEPSAFSFWVAIVLPIDEHEKGKLLPLRSARLRLLLLVHWIDQLNNQWWFSSGCTVL